MSTMFESGEYFVRIKNKSGHLKITIWDNRGEKLLSDFFGPDPASQFWSKVESLTNEHVVADLKQRIMS